MSLPGNQILGFAPMIGSKTATAGTAIVGLIEPQTSGPPTNGRPLYQVDTSQTYLNGLTGSPKWLDLSIGYTRLMKLIYTTAATAHKIYLMRPLNWTYITADVAANATTINIAENPGTFSTKFRYPLSGQAAPYNKIPANTADNALAANDYFAYQLNDGTWVLDTVSSISGLAVTAATATPNVTGGGISAKTPLFMFGIKTDTDPNTGLAHPFLLTIASTNKIDQVPDYLAGFFGSLHRGDPLMILADNATNAGNLDTVTAYYSNF